MKRQFWLVPLAFIFMFVSLLLPKEVLHQSDLEAVELGYPVPFYVQNFSRYTPIEYPQKYSLGSPWEDPAEVRWLEAVISFGVVLGGLNFGAAFFSIVFSRRRSLFARSAS